MGGDLERDAPDGDQAAELLDHLAGHHQRRLESGD